MFTQSDGACKSCHSGNRRLFNGELAIHFPGVNGLKKPIVWAFPKLLVCLDCGCTEFALPERELRVLTEGSRVEGGIIYDKELDEVIRNRSLDKTDGSIGSHESSTVAKNVLRKSATNELATPNDDISRDQ